MNTILVKSIDTKKLALGFVRSDGIIEYDIYEKVKSGSIDSDNSDAGSTIAVESNIVEYIDYELKILY